MSLLNSYEIPKESIFEHIARIQFMYENILKPISALFILFTFEKNSTSSFKKLQLCIVQGGQKICKKSAKCYRH